MDPENGDVDCFSKSTILTLRLWLSCYCSVGVLFTIIWVLLMLTHISCVISRDLCLLPFWPPRYWASCILMSVGGLGSNIREQEQLLIEFPDVKMSDNAQVLGSSTDFSSCGEGNGRKPECESERYNIVLRKGWPFQLVLLFYLTALHPIL